MSMFTQEELYKQLEALGAPQGSVIHVHTSLREIGPAEGRGEGILDVLRCYFTADGGLLTVPTHTWKNLADLSKPTMEVTSPETSIGTLPNLAAVHPAGLRSLHPTHSMAVFDSEEGEGRAAAFVRHDDAPVSSTDPAGCYGRLLEEGGQILLLGVTHNRNTFMHCIEEILDVPNRLSPEPVAATVKLPDGEILERPIRHHRAEGIQDVSANFPKYEPAFRKHGVIREGRFGRATAKLCDARGIAKVMQMIYERSEGKELLADDKPLDPRYYS